MIDWKDAVAVVGASLIVAGSWWIYPPAGVIALGLGLVGLAVVLSYGAKEKEAEEP